MYGHANILRQPDQPPNGPNNKPIRSETVVIEVPTGNDIVRWLFHFCCDHQVSLNVSGGSGWLSDVTFYGFGSPIAGPFCMQSLSGSVTTDSCSPFQVTLGAPGQGLRLYDQMVTGTASGTVFVTAMMTVLKNKETTPSGSNVGPHIMNNVQFGEDDDVVFVSMMPMEPKNDELDDDFWNSLNPIVDLSPFEGV